MFIHGSPDKLRCLASRLEAIAAEAERSGKSHDHFMTETWGGNELSSELQGAKKSHALINAFDSLRLG
ncbi:MAG: Imm32 family immunity protein [Granulosicoccus sp.]